MTRGAVTGNMPRTGTLRRYRPRARLSFLQLQADILRHLYALKYLYYCVRYLINIKLYLFTKAPILAQQNRRDNKIP
jgi:hypothetical protein